MHFWGDEGVDWAGIDAAAEYIGERCRKLGRIPVTQYKEKFGTVRVYCHFGVWGLHGLLKPSHVYYRWPKWTRRFSDWFIRPLTFLLAPWQRFVYRDSYRRALKKWPHLREEILCSADFDELLAGL